MCRPSEITQNCICIWQCRQYRYEQKLARLLWKVDLKDVQLDNKENINMIGWSAAENDIRRKQKVSATNGHFGGGGSVVGSFLPVPAFFPESLETMAKRRKSSSVSKRLDAFSRLLCCVRVQCYTC